MSVRPRMPRTDKGRNIYDILEDILDELKDINRKT